MNYVHHNDFVIGRFYKNEYGLHYILDLDSIFIKFIDCDGSIKCLGKAHIENWQETEFEDMSDVSEIQFRLMQK